MNQNQTTAAAGIYEHALIAVLYAAQKEGVNLEALLAHARNDTAGHPGLRPNPKDLDSVLQAIEHTINDVKLTTK
ncbi:hypothetical protein [Pseudoduganella umbonata]|uniref:Uncharacterized protein n=1 Tax=Pseudoduganella umbonata TaxID=864828 RepID=A0A4P8HUU7_9BURK|nr:hypothetical protein [Pseudoduganella umbonata]MBB3222112.1 hypothetical protein [Pseudoduganella umbonata]QCP12350.1 hypothetical protein FCL38_19440 [Pseudoduganella umbonata]